MPDPKKVVLTLKIETHSYSPTEVMKTVAPAIIEAIEHPEQESIIRDEIVAAVADLIPKNAGSPETRTRKARQVLEAVVGIREPRKPARVRSPISIS